MSLSSPSAPLSRRWLALAVVCLGVVMVVLDATIVNVALPSIRADLGFTEATLVWVFNAYLLTCACRRRRWSGSSTPTC